MTKCPCFEDYHWHDAKKRLQYCACICHREENKKSQKIGNYHIKKYLGSLGVECKEENKK